jgi:hypothetical protein
VLEERIEVGVFDLPYADMALCRRANVHRCIAVFHGVAGADVTGALGDVSVDVGVPDGVAVSEGVALGV